MTGVVNAIAAPSVVRITAVIKSGSGGGAGSGAGAPALFGNTIYPNATITPNTGRGFTFLAFDSIAGTCDFRLDISGNVGQRAFSRVIVTDGSGGKRHFRAIDATYSVLSGNSDWLWNAAGSSPVWSPSDDSETKLIEIIF